MTVYRAMPYLLAAVPPVVMLLTILIAGCTMSRTAPDLADNARFYSDPDSRAADELAVTPGAVSQQIQNLEDYVGVALFKRTPKGLLLTDPAQIALPALREAFDRLADAIGHPEWRGDGRLASRQGWIDHMEDVLRPGIEGWAASRTRMQVCEELGASRVAAAPCLRAGEGGAGPHIAARPG